MSFPPSLNLPGRVVDLAYQSAILSRLGPQTALEGLSFSQIGQLEILQSVLARGTPIETLESAAASARLSLLGDYRRAGVPETLFNRTRRVMGYEFVGLPGGWFLASSGPGGRGTRWVTLDPFFLGKSPVSRALYLKIKDMLNGPDLDPPMGPRWSHRDDETLTGLRVSQYEVLSRAFAYVNGAPVRHPAAAEWEFAARGPAVELGAYLAAGAGPDWRDRFSELVQAQFCRFFFEFGGEVFNDPSEKSFRKRLAASSHVFGYRQHPTVSGRPDPEECPPPWHPTPETTPTQTSTVLQVCEAVEGGLLEVDRDLPRSLTPPADWGPPNVFGFHQLMMGPQTLALDETGRLVAKGMAQSGSILMGLETSGAVKDALAGLKSGLRFALSLPLPEI